MQQPTTTPPAGAQPGGAPQMPGQTLTPEQDQQRQLVARQCMELLSEDATAQMIVAKAQQGDPAKAIADVVVPLLRRVAEAAQEAGAEPDMLAMLVGGFEVIAKLAELMWHAGVVEDEKQVPTLAAQAAKLAVDQHNASLQQGNAPQPEPAAGGGMIAQGA
jgi:hypothetical protein